MSHSDEASKLLDGGKAVRRHHKIRIPILKQKDTTNHQVCFEPIHDPIRVISRIVFQNSAPQKRVEVRNLKTT
nr:hypothetical protein [uncultured Celeribacter sp.]